MRPIRNIHELQAEILRLRKLESEQKQKIKNHLDEVYSEFSPENVFFRLVNSIFGIRFDKKDFLKNGFAKGISYVIQRYILKMEKQAEEKIYEWVDAGMEGIRNFVNRFTDSSARRDSRKEDKEASFSSE